MWILGLELGFSAKVVRTLNHKALKFETLVSFRKVVRIEFHMPSSKCIIFNICDSLFIFLSDPFEMKFYRRLSMVILQYIVF